MGVTCPVKILINMKSQTLFVVSPNPVPANACITVQLSESPFGTDDYRIINEQGELVRKGKISDPKRDFSLSVGGMPDGIYWLVMGDAKERFTIV